MVYKYRNRARRFRQHSPAGRCTVHGCWRTICRVYTWIDRYHTLPQPPQQTSHSAPCFYDFTVKYKRPADFFHTKISDYHYAENKILQISHCVMWYAFNWSVRYTGKLSARPVAYRELLIIIARKTNTSGSRGHNRELFLHWILIYSR